MQPRLSDAVNDQLPTPNCPGDPFEVDTLVVGILVVGILVRRPTARSACKPAITKEADAGPVVMLTGGRSISRFH